MKYNARHAVHDVIFTKTIDDPTWDITKDGGLTCPECDAPEVHPNANAVLIRGYKVESKGLWWSECLVCASADDTATGGYDCNLVWNPNEVFQRGSNNSAAWFC